MDTKELSRLALAELEERGWYQGGYIDQDTGAVCLSGAGLVALKHTNLPPGCVIWDSRWADWMAEISAGLPLSEHRSIPGWNDSAERTYEDVVLLLKRHIAGDFDEQTTPGDEEGAIAQP